MADYATNLDTILTNQAEKEVIVNQLIDAASPSMLYGRHGSACVGLTWAYYGGTFFLPDGSIAEIANGTLTLTASATNYVEVDPASGAISANTSGFTGGRTKIYTVTTGTGTVTDYDDHRSFNILPPGTLAQIANLRILANISGGLSSPVATTLSALLDAVLGNGQGSIIFRGASAWTLLAPGTSGRFLKTGGAGADPSWDVVAGASGGDVVGPASATDGHFVLFDLTTGKLVKDGGLSLDTDGTLAANSDSKIASQKAVVSYVATQLDGRSWKQRVRFKTTANVNLAGGGLAAGTTHDGVTAVAGDRALVGTQTTGAENGIYIVPASGAATRATDADTGNELVNATVEVGEGTTNADTQWTCSTDAPITVDTTVLVWVQTSTSATYTADESTLHLAGSQFSAKDNGITYAKMQDVSATARVLGRKTAGSGDPEECTLSDVLDMIGSAAQGDILYRGASGWARLGAGTAGQFLKTAGAGANPTWDTPSGGGGGTAADVVSYTFAGGL